MIDKADEILTLSGEPCNCSLIPLIMFCPMCQRMYAQKKDGTWYSLKMTIEELVYLCRVAEKDG